MFWTHPDGTKQLGCKQNMGIFSSKYAVSTNPVIYIGPMVELRLYQWLEWGLFESVRTQPNSRLQ